MSERELLEARDDYFRQKEKYIMSENEYKTILSELTEWAQQAVDGLEIESENERQKLWYELTEEDDNPLANAKELLGQ